MYTVPYPEFFVGNVEAGHPGLEQNGKTVSSNLMKFWNTLTVKALAISVFTEKLEEYEGDVIRLDSDGMDEPPVGKYFRDKQREDVYKIVTDIFSSVLGHT